MFRWLLKKRNRNDKVSSVNLQREDIPQHVAIIPDGNGRWAKKRGLPRTAGHATGIKRIREIIRRSGELGVKVLTIYTFSTENWRRPQNEIDYLMKAPINFLTTDLPELIQQNVKVQILGSRSHIPHDTLQALASFEEETKYGTGLILNFAFNYGSRDEIVQAVRSLIKEVEHGHIRNEEIDENLITQHLYTRDLPDPDLLIRTSGEKRVSNFLLWQFAYTEFWFTDQFWPDFTVETYDLAIREFQRRKRRYGAAE